MAVVMCICSSMQKEDSLEHTNASAKSLHSSMQEEDILEHTNAKCHSRTLVVNL